MDEAIDQLRADYDTSPYESSAEAEVRDAAGEHVDALAGRFTEMKPWREIEPSAFAFSLTGVGSMYRRRRAPVPSRSGQDFTVISKCGRL